MTDRGGSFTDGERFPIVRLGLLDQVVKFLAPFEDRLERERGRIRQTDSGAEEKQECEPSEIVRRILDGPERLAAAHPGGLTPSCRRGRKPRSVQTPKLFAVRHFLGRESSTRIAQNKF